MLWKEIVRVVFEQICTADILVILSDIQVTHCSELMSTISLEQGSEASQFTCNMVIQPPPSFICVYVYLFLNP